MIKKVKTADLKLGVFIHDFNCEGLKDILFIDQTLVKNQEIIDIIYSWGIREVYIDTERGIDIPDPLIEMKQSKEEDNKWTGQKAQAFPKQVSLQEEIVEAEKIKKEAARLIEFNMELASKGKPPEVGPTYDLANKMNDSISRNKDALFLLSRIRQRDEYTLYHSISVCSLVLDVCNFSQMSNKKTLDLAVGALFHDIGKALVPRAILNKPGELTEDENRQMKRHVEYAAELLSKAVGLPMEAYDISLYHHERYDGTGYPDGLKGNQISYGAQLTSVCDTFDAITSARCYRAGIGTVAGLRKIYELGGQCFPEKMTYDFIRCLGVYPVGSCVQLQDGLIGIVVGSTENMLQPVVKVIFDNKKKRRVKPYQLDLSKTNDNIESYEESSKIGLNEADVLKEMLA